MNMMIAARAYEGSQELRLEQVPVPKLGARDVLIKVAAAGIAPGIMRLLAYGRFRHLPTIPGHEIAGTVVEAGVEANREMLGQRVRVHPVLTCGKCEYCRSDREQMCSETAMIGHAAFGRGEMELYARYHDGGLAEYVRVPEWLIDRLPDEVGFDVGAKIHDLANAVRALKCAAIASPGRLVITAATGTMGTATIKLASFYGAQSLVLVGRSAARLQQLAPLAGGLSVDYVAFEELGPDWPTTGALTERIRKFLPGGADAVIDFLPDGAGSAQAAASLATGGSFVHMGGNHAALPFSIRQIMHNCWRIVGTRACTRSDAAEVLSLLDSGKLQADDLITHRFSLANISEALNATGSRKEAMWMTVVHPQHAS